MTSPIPESELAEIAARAAKATPGPWAVGRPANSEREAPSIQTVENSGDKWWIASLAEARPRIDEDADFIAAARTDVPRLLAEVKRQAERVRTLEGIALDAIGLALKPEEDFTEADSEWAHEQRAVLLEPLRAALEDGHE